MKAPKKKPMRRGISPIRALPLGYLSVILAGTLLLMLPAASHGEPLVFFDALFTATSASCVTGLVVVDTGTHFTLFGQIVIICLIQLGGLGFMTAATLLFLAAKKRVSLYSRMTLAESFGEESLGGGILSLCARAGRFTLICEGAGAALLALRFIPLYGPAKGIWFSLFHSISAFCNAGFDLIGDYASLTPFSSDAYFLLVISALVITGGLGFAVLGELTGKKKPAGLSLHARLTLAMTASLLLLGTLLVLLFECANPATLGSMPIGEKIVNSFFQSVTLRTAGFNSFEQGPMREITKLWCSILMLIGGAPAGTAGGIKVTTVAVLLLSVKAFLLGSKDVSACGRRINISTVRRAICLAVIALAAMLIALTVMGLTSEGLSLTDLAFEAASALGTVGISAGVTAAGGTAVRAVLCALMYMGRAGILTVALAIGGRSDEAAPRYPEGNVLIG